MKPQAVCSHPDLVWDVLWITNNKLQNICHDPLGTWLWGSFLFFPFLIPGRFFPPEHVLTRLPSGSHLNSVDNPKRFVFLIIPTPAFETVWLDTALMQFVALQGLMFYPLFFCSGPQWSSPSGVAISVFSLLFTAGYNEKHQFWVNAKGDASLDRPCVWKKKKTSWGTRLEPTPALKGQTFVKLNMENTDSDN